MNDADFAARLGIAGLTFLGMVDRAAPLIPPVLATFAVSCSGKDVADVATVELAGTRPEVRANSRWYDISLHGGLFGLERQVFLVALNCADNDRFPIWWWGRVELQDQWDIIGAGAASGLLGNGYCAPAFVMLSLDGTVIVRGDVWETSIGAVLVQDPHRIRALRQHGAWMVRRPRTDECTRAAIQRWLDAHQEEENA